VRFNTVIKQSNLDQIIPIAERARELGCGVNFSSYSDSKNGNRDGLIPKEKIEELADVTSRLLEFKKRHRGVIANSDYYLETIPLHVSGQMKEPCRSGLRTIHVNPTGHVKRCPDFPVDFHWSEFKKYKPVDCNACYYACRGEAQAPLRLSRIRDVMA